MHVVLLNYIAITAIFNAMQSFYIGYLYNHMVKAFQ